MTPLASCLLRSRSMSWAAVRGAPASRLGRGREGRSEQVLQPVHGLPVNSSANAFVRYTVLPGDNGSIWA